MEFRVSCPEQKKNAAIAQTQQSAGPRVEDTRDTVTIKYVLGGGELGRGESSIRRTPEKLIRVPSHARASFRNSRK
jgi:hypothetical protein